MTDREYACGLKLSANGKVINTNTIFLYYSSAILAHTVWISIILQTEEEEVSNCILFAFIIITFSIPDCYKFFCKFQETRKSFHSQMVKLLSIQVLRMRFAKSIHKFRQFLKSLCPYTVNGKKLLLIIWRSNLYFLVQNIFCYPINHIDKSRLMINKNCWPFWITRLRKHKTHF